MQLSSLHLYMSNEKKAQKLFELFQSHFVRKEKKYCCYMLNNADQFSLESALTIIKVNENKNSEKVDFFLQNLVILLLLIFKLLFR